MIIRLRLAGNLGGLMNYNYLISFSSKESSAVWTVIYDPVGPSRVLV